MDVFNQLGGYFNPNQKNSQSENGGHHSIAGDKFPNGFTSWAETHFEIVRYICQFEGDGGVIGFTANMGGTGALYELAEQWADDFEQLNKDRGDSDGEFFDEIESFCNQKNNSNKIN
jgi:hypothetical protein